MNIDNANIVRILSVVDTRDFEEISRNGHDIMVPIPGSGDVRECDRCRRLHEVHATVELSNGDLATVGTGCMRGDAMLPELRKAASRATTTAKNRAQLARVEARLAEVEQIRHEVLELPLPAVTSAVVNKWGETRRECVMGDASILLALDDRSETSMMPLTWSWRQNRERERGIRLGEREGLMNRASDLRRRLARP